MAVEAAFTEVPLVDVTALHPDADPQERAAAATALGAAARHVGFAYITGHRVPQETIAELRAAAKRFFEQPLEVKEAVHIRHSRDHRGYVPEGEEVFADATEVDRKEAFDLGIDLPADDPDYVAGNPLLGPNQWPALPGFAEAVGRYYDLVLELGRRLLRGFAMALGEAPEAFDHLVTKPPSQLRLIHYPYQPGAEDRPGIGAHTDYEFFTILHSTAPGLEVLNGAGEWIDAPPVPGAFVINIGDMLELLTNGEFVATTHRVRSVREERWSFPLFFSLDYHTAVAPLPRFVTAERPAARPGLIAGEHLFAQTAQSFRYLRERLATGEAVLPDGAMALSSFGSLSRTPEGQKS